MPRTPTTALRAVLKITLLTATLAVALFAQHAATAPAAAQAKGRDACANHLCTRDKPVVTSCRDFGGHVKVARCFVTRAARHYDQSVSLARSIAWRESRYHWWITNSSAHRGLYQFTDTLWAHTPYSERSVYNPRYASLAAMWLWRHGGMHHWAL
jgi:hypothetical protein